MVDLAKRLIVSPNFINSLSIGKKALLAATLSSSLSRFTFSSLHTAASTQQPPPSPSFTTITASPEQILKSIKSNGITSDDRRPLSPHMTIYAPQLTWMLSIMFRLCGAGMVMATYGFGIAAAFNLISVPALVNFIVGLPTALATGCKLALALPFTYHTFNGFRHLAWDAGVGLTLRGIYLGGYLVLSASAIATLFLLLVR